MSVRVGRGSIVRMSCMRGAGVMIVMPRLGLRNQRADQQQQHRRQRGKKRQAIPMAMREALKWHDEHSLSNGGRRRTRHR